MKSLWSLLTYFSVGLVGRWNSGKRWNSEKIEEILVFSSCIWFEGKKS